MAEGKWAEGLLPEMTLREAARAVLEARLGVVLTHLPAALRPGDDPEHVHQLRVATRRADAALRIFRDCLAKHDYRAARARLRGLRRAAGAARDWDVFLIALRDRAAEARRADVAGNDFLVAYSLGQRAAAQAALEAVAAREPDDFPGFIDATLAELRQPQHEPHARLGEMARPKLAGLLERFALAASADLSDYEHLHQVRIRGKRLRYAIEVLAGCFAPPLRERYYPMVEEMQETLGRANDSHVAMGRLRAVRDALAEWPATRQRVKGGVEGLLRFHQRRLPQERRRFVTWWRRWQEAAPETALVPPAVAPTA